MSNQFGEAPYEHVQHGLPEDDSPRPYEPDTDLLNSEPKTARPRMATGFKVLAALVLIAIGAQTMGLSSLISFSNVVATRDVLKNEIESLEIRRVSANEAADIARQEAAKQKDTYERITRDISNGEAERVGLAREVAVLTRRVTDLTEKETNLGHLSKDLESLKVEVSTLEKKKGELDKEISAKQTTLGGMEAELEEKKTELASTWDQLIDKKKRVEAEEVRAQKAQLVATDAENRVTAAEEQLRRLNAQIEGLRESKEDAEGKLATTNAQLDACRGNVEAESARLIGIMGQISTKTRDRDDLDVKIDELKSSVASLAEDEQRLRSLTDSLGDIRELQIEIENLEASKRDAEDMYTKADLQLKETLERAKRVLELLPQWIQNKENELRRAVEPNTGEVGGATAAETGDENDNSGPTRGEVEENEEGDPSEVTDSPASRENTTVQP
jgi:chromosome segregation ATPase